VFWENAARMAACLPELHRAMQLKGPILPDLRAARSHDLSKQVREFRLGRALKASCFQSKLSIQ